MASTCLSATYRFRILFIIVRLLLNFFFILTLFRYVTQCQTQKKVKRLALTGNIRSLIVIIIVHRMKSVAHFRVVILSSLFSIRI